MIFYISAVSIVISPFFISDFVYLGSFSPLLGESGQRVVNCLPFRRTSSWFYWFFSVVFWISILLISSLIFMISFLLLTLGLFHSFSNSFRLWVKLSILDFSSFLRKACIAMNFSLSTAFAASHRFWVVVFIIICLEVFFNFLLDFLIDPLVF